jgi:23S rRNA (guanosine2251-2'-O)-methyltransferase
MNNNDLVITGRNMVHDALMSDQTIEKLYVAKSSRNDPRIREIMKLADKNDVEISFVNSEKLKTISGSDDHQGVVAYMQKYQETSLKEVLEKCRQDGRDPLILLFNSLDYEQNLGAILRNAWGASVDAVVLNPSGVHEVTPVVARVSQGAAAYVPVISQSLFQAMTLLKDEGIPIVGVEVGMGKSCDETNLLGPIAFLLGGEQIGISQPQQEYCDIFTHIPINNELASLNVSVATALIVFEKRRQERAVAVLSSRT